MLIVAMFMGKLGKFEVALSDYNTALYLDKDLLDVYLTRGTVNAELDHIEAAIRDFDYYLSHDGSEQFNNMKEIIALRDQLKTELSEQD